MVADFGKRFSDLSMQAESLEENKRVERASYGTMTYVDGKALLNWKVKVRHLLSAVCGSDSEHLTQFGKAEEITPYTTNHEIFQRMKAVFLAAKEDYEGGYLHSIRDLVQADVFDNELEQAEELVKGRYYIPAAVIAGVVLETRLRQLCKDNNIPTGKLDKMNADLARIDVYDKLVQKQITALADLRNKAAHGEAGYGEMDVTNMIRDVRNLLVGRLE